MLSGVARKLLHDHLFSMTLTYYHSPVICAGSFWRFVKLAGKKSVDERTRTAYPCSLREIIQVLQGFA
jgi:hypothetical protein